MVAPLPEPCCDLGNLDLPPFVTLGGDSPPGRGSGDGASGCWGTQLGPPQESRSELELLAQLGTEPYPPALGWPTAGYKREFLALSSREQV